MVCMDLLMLDSYNRDDMDIEIIQTSLDIAMTKNKQSNVQTSPNIVITKNKQSNVHYVPTILQPKLQNMETNTDMGLKDLDKLSYNGFRKDLHLEKRRYQLKKMQ